MRVATPAPSNPFHDMPRTGTVARFAAAWAIAQAVQQLSHRATSMWRERAAYSVKLQEADPLYPDVHEWVLSLMPTSAQRALAVSTGSTSTTREPTSPEGDVRSTSRLRLAHDSSRSRIITVGEHRVSVRVERPDAPADSVSRQPENIRFTCASRAAQHAVLDELRTIQNRRTRRRPTLRGVASWGGWASRSDVPPRPWRSVVIDQDQKDRIEHDLETFLAAEDAYLARGIPWHRGYLFHGPPGTGKTSIAKGLANRFGLDVWYLALSDLNKDASLMGLLAEVSPRSMLLLEDVDTVAGARDRDTDTANAISTGSLLNALDGIATPHGLITVMTTNRLDTLDSALVRAGRMDVVEEISYPAPREIRGLYELFYPGEHLGPIRAAHARVSQAEVAEVLKQHLHDPQAGATALLHLLHSQHAPTAGRNDR